MTSATIDVMGVTISLGLMFNLFCMCLCEKIKWNSATLLHRLDTEYKVSLSLLLLLWDYFNNFLAELNPQIDLCAYSCHL